MPRKEANKMVNFNAFFLNKLLAEKGISKTELARRIACNRKTLTRAMHNARISKYYLVEIANELDVSPRVLTSENMSIGGYSQLAKSIFQIFDLNTLKFDSASPEDKTKFLSEVITSLAPILKEHFPIDSDANTNDELYNHLCCTMINCDLDVYRDCEYIRANFLANPDAIFREGETIYRIRHMDDGVLYSKYYKDFDDSRCEEDLLSVFKNPEAYEVLPYPL